ncbi:grainyhead-like protein 1 homolog isoform X4 [Halichondria panicea]|uniref:grainyhead-like protein 1 homolog isoform X4 n=1 Tax=Halichondria panicea TaxID=6063 RepID=UPI00312B5860
MSADNLPTAQMLPSNESSPQSSNESGGNAHMTRKSSDPGHGCSDPYTDSSGLMYKHSSPTEIIVTEAAPVFMGQNHMHGSSDYFSELPELVHSKPPLGFHHHSDAGGETGEESSMSWLYDFYPGIFRYEVTLGAPTSSAQRTNDDTLTYLNKGQFYTLYFKGNSSLQLPSLVKTVLALTFFEEPDKRVEHSRWQYWYNMQPNPNQKAFDIDRKSCKNIEMKPDSAASFTWHPKVGAKIVLRVNCLSTEFSSQKGVKGYTLHFVSDTYDDMAIESAEPVHRAFCRVKIFRDKGAERKNKDETKYVERKLQKMAKQVKPGVSLETELGASLFHAPSRETVFTSTSTLGPKSFLFIPQQHPDMNSGMVRDETAATDFLASIRDRESKRTFGNTLRQTKDEFGALEMDKEGEECEGAPPKKAPRIRNRKMMTIYVRKEDENVYKALMLDCASVYDLKLEVGKKFDAPADMIQNVYKRTKKGLVVQMDDSMVEQFQSEDDFIIDLSFDNQKGSFDLYLHY